MAQRLAQDLSAPKRMPHGALGSACECTLSPALHERRRVLHTYPLHRDVPWQLRGYPEEV
eukprot:CAMPEP_0174337928 /NCGR_PEP_ID=MMETSP0810-20121108/22728_1 /TAXON_ID=73025 ORGANISM="Eutreptiella gymnastica-like, Strain CCMP1594" /NCGR_SAMPLE_ID=MMETSP0810 /ASSEMBLY_ACC=CAM_ASM_000659 /LENGTH=59 /DNA_ID=CAMNT_0015457707 /DNA_START=191 /DNA_END=370 /DNA_ORIENTATION=+